MSNIDIDFITKLESLQQEFNSKVEKLKNDYLIAVKNSDSLTVKTKYEYRLIEPEKIEEIKTRYKNSTRHYFYSYNALQNRYTEAFEDGKRNGAVRWFKQIAVYYPDSINTFIDINRKNLLKDYELLLLHIGFQKIKKGDF